MVGQRNESREMEESFARFSIEDEEYGGLTYAEDSAAQSEIDTKWCLVGSFLLIHRLTFKSCSIKWLHYGVREKACT